MSAHTANLAMNLRAEELDVRELVREVARELAAADVSWPGVRLLLGKARNGAAECARLQGLLTMQLRLRDNGARP